MAVALLTGRAAADCLAKGPMVCVVLGCPGKLTIRTPPAPPWHIACDGKGRHLFTKESLYRLDPKLVEWPD